MFKLQKLVSVLIHIVLIINLYGCGTVASTEDTSSTTITADTIPPSLALDPVPAFTVNKSSTISGTAEAGVTIYVQTDNASSGYATISGNNWNYIITDLKEGINNVSVTATDSTGNTSKIITSINRIITKVIAHRGSSYTAPENTLAAFNLAWQQGSDGVELDIFLSKDNRIMVIHDPTTGRTAGTDIVVKDTTSTILRTLDVGKLKGSQYSGEKIPFLEEAIATIPPGKKLYVEIKTGVEILPFLQQVINDSGKKDQIIVHSFDLTVDSEFKKMMPEILTLYISGSLESDQQLFQKAVSNKLDGLNVAFQYITSSLASAARNANMQLFSWTVNDTAMAKSLRGFGVNGIITDRPDLILDVLQ